MSKSDKDLTSPKALPLCVLKINPLKTEDTMNTNDLFYFVWYSGFNYSFLGKFSAFPKLLFPSTCTYISVIDHENDLLTN